MCNSMMMNTQTLLLLLLSFTLMSFPNPTSSQKLHISPNTSISSLENSARRIITAGNSKMLNPIDLCWRSKANWAANRQSLANCALGFGQGAVGGRDGKIYIVRDESDGAVDPKPGTLRYAVTREESLWIIFERDMIIALERVLVINSNKTIDGRGVKVEITQGPCFEVKHAKHVIIHGISFSDCRPSGPAVLVQKSPTRQSQRKDHKDGDGIRITNSSHIWIDHCYFSNSSDGLVDVTDASKLVTISNSRFTHHNKVMLLGNSDSCTEDRVMQVTVAFNHFGPGLEQRMPRVRYGYAHVANNYYEPWGQYAIGGSFDPTILSEANLFVASHSSKQVTKRIVSQGSTQEWKNWKWTSTRDKFINGAYFIPSGHANASPPYSKTQSFLVQDASRVPDLTFNAGPLSCVPNKGC